MGEANIVMKLKDNKIAAQTDLKDVSQPELGMLIAHLELVRLDFLAKYNQSIKKIKGE